MYWLMGSLESESPVGDFINNSSKVEGAHTRASTSRGGTNYMLERCIESTELGE